MLWARSVSWHSLLLLALLFVLLGLAFFFLCSLALFSVPCLSCVSWNPVPGVFFGCPHLARPIPQCNSQTTISTDCHQFCYTRIVQVLGNNWAVLIWPCPFPSITPQLLFLRRCLGTTSTARGRALGSATDAGHGFRVQGRAFSILPFASTAIAESGAHSYISIGLVAPKSGWVRLCRQNLYGYRQRASLT